MQHYGVGEWTDFVRNLVSDEQRMEMDEHRIACSECGTLLQFLSNVAIAGQSEYVYEEASAALSRSARQVFSTDRPARVRDRVARALRTLVAKMTYDSAADLQPAGARAYRPTSRQMLYQVEDFYLDLRFDRELDSTRVTVVGQVANRNNPSFRRSGLPVLLLAKTNVIAQTESNEFGEFALDYIPQRDLRLSVQIPDAGIEIEAPVNGVLGHHEP